MSATDSVLRDLRPTLRRLAAGRAFTLTALATLAVSIGAAVTVFSVFNSVLLRPLPVPEPQRLVLLYNSYPGAGVPRVGAAVPDYFDRREQVPALETVALVRTPGFNLSEGEAPERVRAGQVTPSYFDLARTSPIRGRAFTEEDGEVGRERKAILSYALWQRLFAGDDGVLGRDVRLDGRPYTVVGVMPEGFRLPPSDVDLWIPAAFTAEDRSDDRRHSNNFGMLGRLTPEASIQQVQQQVDQLNARSLERFPDFKQLLEDARFHTVVVGLADDLVREIRPRLVLLLAGALFVLLIGCINLTNLVLVRTASRERELATRSALGAGPLELARQLFTEYLLLALAGGALGLGLGWGGVRLLARLGADRIPRGAEIAVDGRVLAATAAVSLAIGALFGTLALVRVLRGDLTSIFRQESRTGSASRRAVRGRSLLVTAQVAFAFVLLAGAGLLLTSFGRLAAVDPGFATAGVLTGSVSLPDERYPKAEDVRAFARRLLEPVRALPGVVAAGLTDSLPFGGNFNASVISPEGRTPQPGESLLAPVQRRVSAGYFEAAGIPLLKGRTFDSRDTTDSTEVVIVDRWLAERYWPNQDPIGKRLCPCIPEQEENPRWKTVVGVVGEIRYAELGENEVQGAYYFPLSQNVNDLLSLTVRTEGDPRDLAGPLRRTIQRLDPELALFDVRTMEERVDESLTSLRLALVIASVSAVLALFLAAVGLYGVLAYAVAERRRELGIRMALGSTQQEIFRLVLVRGLAVLGAGLVLGLVGALLVGRSMAGLLYGVAPSDPGVLTAVGALLAMVALAASVLPARRATRVDPVEALAG
jgi:predicted permease